MPSLRRGRRGDQRVVVNVVIPRKLSAEQREMLKELAATLDDENLREDGDESLFAQCEAGTAADPPRRPGARGGG